MAWTPEQKREAYRCEAEAEGRAVGSRPGFAATRPHGTEAAYRRHIRAGESPCDPCRQAHAEAVRQTRSKKL